MSEAASRSICIVDDDDAVRDSLKMMLESLGMQVRDFASARDFLERGGFRDCGCLVLDLNMPAMSGLELLDALRDRHISVPTVMVTGRPDPALATRMGQIGLFAVLSKPVSETVLLDRIAGAISGATH